MDRQNKSNTERRGFEAFDFVMPLPLPDDVVDIFQLANGRPEMAVSLLEELVRGKLSQELSTDFKTVKWAFEQSVELQNRTRLYGGHWLWLGFPFIQVAKADRAFIAPLWLWPLQLKAPTDTREGWLLETAPDTPPQLNPRLDAIFREQLGWEDAAPWWQSAGGELNSLSELSSLVSVLVDKMQIDSYSQSVSISPWSAGAFLPAGQDGRKLIWSGLMGIFPPSFPEAAAAQDLPPEKKGEKTIEHSFGLLERDPWQETAFQLTRTNRGTLVHGAAKSGKSTLLKDMLVNALSRGERCLVLSDRMEVLKGVQEGLAEIGLQELVVLFHQVRDESGLVLQLIRNSAKQKKKSTFAANTFRQQLGKLDKLKIQLDRAYRAANKKILGPYTWTQVSGLYLAAARLESKALLGSQLNAQDFDLGFERYQLLRDKLDYSQALFNEIRTLNHPLTVLNAGIFVHQEKEEARSFIFARMGEITEAATTLQHRFILEQNDYGDRLVESYEQFYRQLNEQTRSLYEKVNTYRKTFGRDPLESTKTTLKLYARFSDKFRRTLAAKEDLARSYQELEKTLKDRPYFHHDFLPLTERHLLGKLSSNLESLQNQLRAWREQLGQSVQDELLRLSSKTVHAELPGYQRIEELETDLDLLVEGLNDSGLFQLPLENKNLTLPKRQRFLEEILEKMDLLRFNMRDFDRFYEWQRYWFGLPAEARRIITALVKVKPDDWPAAFSSWYLHHQLLHTADPNLPEKESELEDFVTGLHQLRRQLPDQIRDHWADRRAGILHQLKKERRPLYDYLTAKKDQGRRLSLHTFKEALSSFFPVILSSPLSDYPFLDPERGYDLILVDEAHTLSTDLLRVWEQKCRRMVLFQNPAYGNLELAEWARRQAWPQIELGGDYSERLPNIQLEEVEGRYNSRQSINDEEARKLLSLLNTVEENPQRTLPKLSIVCFTRPQRNLILQYLDRIKRQRLAGFEKVQQLERNGLGVYVPDELYGLTTDLLIVSCTYGRTGAADQLTTDIQNLDHIITPGLVPLLRSRAREGQIILHSIPEEDLYRLSRDRSDRNTVQLARWLLRLRAEPVDAPPQRGEEDPVHPLAAEIAWHVADQVRTDRLAFAVPFQRANLPLTVTPLREEGRLALLLNGYLAETPFASYEWEWNQRRALEAEGYRIYPVWSVSWWKRPEQAAAEFAQMVNTSGEEEE
ncbi:hypothetical protein [Flavilitoribacter nigricans]|uniref:Uncharacterized protein n=1 Tax=Flavilitoribacter nigricans (strain ATCC 23147 / DSM 23189 / NBRC 102662 / NCIMB 1420 / SS-2) TaxID=1122177 RepID=A0A2D0MZV5_FLAN2|nr:hypothetical protein [Flavilitoribacter nigricans]PHN01804.1 hypothetical protein CRP01_35570 [Flavilitoribacter nigricans DSM 23189 = NBRC 102662]